MNEKGLRAFIAPLSRRVSMMASRAVVRLVSDELSRQQMQVEILKGELRDNVERMQNYGFTSVPQSGADAAVVFLGGNRSQGIIIAVDDRRYRLTGLEAGEVAVYDDLGNKIELKRDRIKITAETLLDIVAPDVHIAGHVTITGNVDTTGTLKNNTKNVGSTHTHSGVQTGGGNTGAPN
jgi:phage gp45-like